MRLTDTYQSAISRCASLNGKILSTLDNVHNFEFGREYWSNIYRAKVRKWITDEVFHEICNQVQQFVNIDCVYLKVIYRKVKYIPLPCKYAYKAICKPKQPGDLGDIRHCPAVGNTDIFT
ncbi:uncharacterized protein LOC134726974 [Mytilus trossulus]|uniref:uncharacterized protein LOC134726974 n=1 Tax=Mytilus trossulus TaxID=6551 RepID=UPI0030075656